MKFTNRMTPTRLAPLARVVLAFAAALPLAGCMLAPSGETISPAALEALLRQAEAAQASNDLVRSASLLEQAAAAAQSPKQEELRLQAAQLYLDLNKPKRARALLKQTRGRELVPSSAALRRIVQARLALASGDGAGALAALSPRPSPMPEALHAAWLGVEANAHLAEGQPLAAARLRDQRSALLRKPSSRQANQQALWSALLAIPMEQLVGLIPPIPDRFGGWLELAYFYRTRQVDAQALEAALHAWQERYPSHPAAGPFLASVLTTARQSVQRPNAIALLLPLSGPLTAIGRAVEHGFMAAYYQDAPQQRPNLLIYDIADSSVNSLSAYHDAVAGGADIVVGPLTKVALLRLTVLDFAPIPILGLNTLPNSTASTQGLYQFGLAPEDDAFAAAELAWQRGYRSAVILTPNSEWGERVTGAFRERFQSLGGHVLELAHYAPQESDFSEPIQAVLNLDVSVRRYKQLRAFLKRDIEFRPRRREDMDFIFIGAFPREARLIRPQIRFHYGMGVPVIATAQAYEGTPTPAADKDMNGLLLGEMPWLIPKRNAAADPLSRDRMAQIWPESTQHYPQLYALGMDAYRLTALIALLHSDSGLQIEGRTGQLTMDPSGVIHRELQPAHFVDGLLQPLDTRPSRPTQQTQAGSHG